nr:myc box-dependent-interacting protein 1 isoform X1 [Onthophagus taurus]
MAESRGSLLAKSVQKHAGRAKEKLLQNLGKVDKTLDDIFDEHLQNFNRQQLAANRLQKEFSNYLRAVRNVQVASKSLLEAIGDTYESSWSGHDNLYVQTQSVDSLWQDFYHKLTDQVCIPLNTYQSQFPEMKKKIDKRGRKLVDYDSQRHSFQALQLNMAKKRDETKIARGKEQLEEAKRTYEMLNSELHDELPALYDSRILFLVTNLQTLFNAEQNFHNEASKVFGTLENIVDKLATDSQRSSYSVKRTNGTASISRTTPSSFVNNISTTPTKINPIPDNDAKTPTNSEHTPEFTTAKASRASVDSTPPASPSPTTPKSPGTPPPRSPISPRAAPVSAVPPEESIEKTNEDIAPPPSPEAVEINGGDPGDDEVTPQLEKPDKVQNGGNKTTPTAGGEKNESVNKNVEELYDIPVGASTDNLPPGVLYRVKSTYKYNREDVDELSFDVGEIIQVIEYDDPEEQEEGWLMGIKESNGEKGMFPANFTRPL